MYVGTQMSPRDDTDFEVWAQLGVNNICWVTPGDPRELTLEDLNRYREKVESYGIRLDMIQLPPIIGDRSAGLSILLGNSPERDREIENICRIIECCARAGIPSAKYNFNFQSVRRTDREPGRGGSSNSAFRWSKVNPKDPPGPWGVAVDEDTIWERLDYFLERVVPVATENKIRIGCHPHDPYTPPGYRGVTRILGTVEGMKRFVQMHESPYHGLNFCQGTVTEMLDNPGEEIFDVIRWFGSRGKIFNVHFRNIRGRKLDFMETFPDEGSINMWECLKTYKEVGYKYMLMPDHVPQISGENPRGVGFAYAYGYITALLQAIGEPREQGWIFK